MGPEKFGDSYDIVGRNIPQPQVLHAVDDVKEQEFRDLVTRWHEETDGHSSPVRITSNAAYRGIIALGKSALPLILAELDANGGYWYPALKAISNEDPVPDSARGKPRLIRKAWLDWGKKNKLNRTQRLALHRRRPLRDCPGLPYQDNR